MVSTRLKLRMILLLVFCLPGIAIVGYSVKLAASSIELTNSGSFETGVIVKYERPNYRGRAKIGSSLCPVIEFQHANMTHTFTDEWCSKSPKDHPVGSRVPVVIAAGSPGTARINAFWELHGASLVSALIGIPWLLIGIALVVRVR